MIDTPSTPPVAWQNRIVGHAVVPAKDLLANPGNWRIHPTEQQQALAKVLDKVGWVQDVVVNRTSGFIVDGHLRTVLAAEENQQVPVAYVELSEAEENLILATFDQITGMAVPDAEKLAALMSDVQTDFPDLSDMLDRIGRSSEDEEPPPAEGWSKKTRRPSLRRIRSRWQATSGCSARTGCYAATPPRPATWPR